MRSTILNRQFEHPTDGWYQIEVPGDHPNTDGAVVQVIDGVAVDHIVTTFNREAADYRQKHGVDFPGMLIDHEHFKHDADKETRAYGWLMELENRAGKPFGRIMWTATGKAATDGGDYRFFSTEYDKEDLQVINRNTTPPQVRPLRLAGLTLTNDPNNKGGAPITNRSPHAEFAQHDDGPSCRARAGRSQSDQGQNRLHVCPGLGASAPRSAGAVQSHGRH
jgi:phage I-like protein